MMTTKVAGSRTTVAEKETKRTLPLFKVFMADSAAEQVEKTLNSGYIGQGPEIGRAHV